MTNTVAKTTAAGTLHDAPSNDVANVMKTLGSAVTQPHTSLSASVTLTGTVPPLTAVYTYVEKNDSSTPSPIVGVTATDDACSPVAYVSGDTNANKILDPGEAWVFGCRKQITKPGVYLSHVTAAGTNAEDNRDAPPEAAEVSMTVQVAKALPATSGPFKGPLPVTGPSVPVAPLGVLALVLIGLGGFCVRRRPLPNPSAPRR